MERARFGERIVRRPEGLLVSPVELRAFAGHFATGVAVVTSRTATGDFCGITITALSSVSLSPPLFLVCLDARSTTLEAVLASGVFALHFLDKAQIGVSRGFDATGGDPFAAVAHRIGGSGCPILEGVLAVAECAVSDTCRGGDHIIVIGEVASVAVYGGEPLLRHRGAYVALRSKVAAN